MKQYATIEDTIYCFFAGNDTSGSGGDGASPAADVRLAGAAADAIPILSLTPILLTHANYPAGCYEAAIAATAANGFAANNTYAVFCTLAIDSQNPTGFVGSFDLKPILANAKQLNGTNQTGRDIGANMLLSPGTGVGQLDFTSGVVKSNLAQILGTALTETAGYIAAGFKKLFNVATPLLVASDVMRGTDGANTIVPDAAGTATSLHTTTNNKIDTNKTEIDGLQGADGKCLISTDAQDLSGTLDVNTKTATATALDLILEDSTFALAIKDAIWNAILTGATFNIPTSAGRRVRQIGAYAIHDGTAQAGANISITFAATASAVDGTYNRNLVVITGGTGIGQTRTIIDFDGTTKIAIVDRGWRTDPDATSEYQVVPDDTPLVVDQGVAQVGSTSSTIKLRAYASAIDDIYLCNIVIIVAGTGRGQARLVGAYNGATKVITLCGDDWITTPDNTSVYVIIPYGATCTACLGIDALASINTEIDNALDTAIPESPTAGSINEKIKALPSGIAKNVALSNLDIYMLLEDGITAATGKTVTGQIRKDAGSFTGFTNAITEISGGLYTIADGITQAEMNADKVTLKFTADGCRDTIMIIYPA